MVDDTLVRIAQDSNPAYRSNVGAFKITTLTSDSYQDHSFPDNPVLVPGNGFWKNGEMYYIDDHALYKGDRIVCVAGCVAR